jgi:hypothetical protein
VGARASAIGDDAVARGAVDVEGREVVLRGSRLRRLRAGERLAADLTLVGKQLLETLGARLREGITVVVGAVVLEGRELLLGDYGDGLGRLLGATADATVLGEELLVSARASDVEDGALGESAV